MELFQVHERYKFQRDYHLVQGSGDYLKKELGKSLNLRSLSGCSMSFFLNKYSLLPVEDSDDDNSCKNSTPIYMSGKFTTELGRDVKPMLNSPNSKKKKLLKPHPLVIFSFKITEEAFV